MASMYRAPLAPAPSTPIVNEVTLLRVAPVLDRSMFQTVHTLFARSPAPPLYGTLVLLILRYNWPPLPATPWNHSDRLLMPLAVQSCGVSKVRVASEIGAL